MKTLRVPVDGGKYVIKQDDSGRLSVSRGDLERWLDAPPGSKMLVSVAYELVVLRRLVAAILPIVEGREGFIQFGELVRELEGYMDFRPNLTDPGDI